MKTTLPPSLDARASGGDRLDDMLARYLGPTITQALAADDDVTEVYLNPQDQIVRYDTRSRGRIESGVTLSSHRAMMFLNAVASHLGVTLTSEQPRLEAELSSRMFRGARLQGFIPPVTVGPTFVIRKPPAVVFTLDHYVAAGILSEVQRLVLSEAVTEHESILVAGGTNSGKTTLANALLKEISDQFPSERLVILEDTVELQCAAPDHVALRTGRHVTLADLVRSALRTSPSRIVVGEVRGSEALDLLDAWATGHPGGVATVHASSAPGALLRLDRLARRANVPSQLPLITEAIDLVVIIEGTNAGRRVSDIAAVERLGEDGSIGLRHLTESGEWV